jgi:hypothetical protein
MGCSCDIVRVGFKNEEHAKFFAEMFYEELKDELYGLPWCSKPEHFKVTKDLDERFWMCVESEPIYRSCDYCDNGVYVVRKFLHKYPEADLYASLEESFNNCGDTHMVTMNWNPDERILHYEYRGADIPYIDYCDECDYDCNECPEDEDEETWTEQYIAHMETHEPGTVYHCPNCGCEIEYDVVITRKDIPYDELLKNYN